MNRALVIMVFAVLSSLFRSCVERYYPEEDELRTGTLVINAHLTNQPGEQVIEISRSAPLIDPVFDPVSGCLAEVIREDGELRIFSESETGDYIADLDTSFLQTGCSYLLHVTTPDGKEYESGFDRIRPVPEIDSLYYQVELASFTSRADTISGIRFYLDFTYDDEAFEYIRWDMTETYEFHNPRLLPENTINIEIHRVCYITNELPTIYSMSLATLDFGTYIKKPLTFIPNNQLEQKLHHKYSLLVKQFSLGPEAFYYWNELKKTSQEQGWLYDRQPAMIKSNIHNVNDESEVVLGLFSMAGVAEKRAFAVKPEGLDLRLYKYYCLPEIEELGNTLSNVDGIYIVIYKDGMHFSGPVNEHCLDCRLYRHSTDIMPDFW